MFTNELKRMLLEDRSKEDENDMRSPTKVHMVVEDDAQKDAEEDTKKHSEECVEAIVKDNDLLAEVEQIRVAISLLRIPAHIELTRAELSILQTTICGLRYMKRSLDWQQSFGAAVHDMWNDNDENGVTKRAVKMVLAC
jgi:hypothetical protein